MPFILYDVTRTQSGKQYSYIRKVQIAGKTGPLAAIYCLKNPKGVNPFPWHAPLADIVQATARAQPNQEILIDLKPNVAKNVSLYRLLDVWGFSYPHWTPLALRMEALFSDLPHDDPAKFKASFTDQNADHPLVGEFVYVQGGTAGGTWNWGQLGRANGTLLLRDAFDYLCGALTKSL